MYYEIKSVEKIDANQEDVYAAITQRANTDFLPLAEKSFVGQGDYFNQSTPSWCVKDKIAAWEQTRNNTISLRDRIDGCKIRVKNTRYQIVEQNSGVRVELIVGYRTLSKTPFKIEEFDNYLGAKLAMSKNLNKLKDSLEDKKETAHTQTIYA